MSIEHVIGLVLAALAGAFALLTLGRRGGVKRSPGPAPSPPDPRVEVERVGRLDDDLARDVADLAPAENPDEDLDDLIRRARERENKGSNS